MGDTRTVSSFRLLLSVRWLVVGLGVGIAASVASGVVVALAPQSPSSGTTAAIVLLPVALGALVGLTTGSFVRLQVGGKLLAITAAFSALFVGPVVPMGPIPVLLAVGACAVAERAWVRVTAALALLLAVAFLVGAPLVAFLRGVDGPVGVGAVAAVGLGTAGALATLRYVRPTPV